MAPPRPAGVSVSGAPAASLWKVHAVMVLVQCANGGATVLNKAALTTGVNPIVYAVYRAILALCAVAPVAYFAESGKHYRLDFTTVALFALLGVIGLAFTFHSHPKRHKEAKLIVFDFICVLAGFSMIFAFQLLWLFGLKLATASLSSLVGIITTIGVFFISAVFGLEDVNWRRFDGQAKLGGFMCAVVGGVLIALYKGPVMLGSISPGLHSGLGSKSQLDGDDTSSFTMLALGIETWQIGVILLFLSGISMAIFVTLQIPALKRYPAPVSLNAFGNFFGALTLAILGVVTVQDPSEWVIHQPSAIISVLFAGVISSGVTTSLQTWALQRAGPVLVTSYNPLRLFVTSALALIFLGESIHLGSMLGTLLIISGLYFITWGKIEGPKLGAGSVNAVPTRDGLPTITAVSSLEEPLLR